ncbi:MAG: N-acetylmuramoyl-L-alanine amidase [Oscillospiraceae bacterium]|jgi:N-acetylmuramoyl-L-alanine amidase|nr:N-acetylmuramoyl-L-alanine amidase [Oscillospiraceae bacterium]
MIKKIWIPAVILFVTLTIIALDGVRIQSASNSQLSNSAAMPRNYIIDAGHGGADGGAVAGDVIESDINLDVALKLDSLMALFGYQTVMTRDTPDIDYPDDATTLRKMKNADSRARRALIQSTPNAVLISIHQNKYKSPKANGTRVFYAVYDGSKNFADRVTTTLNQAISAQKTYTSMPIDKDIYLMKQTNCPAILVECGFISNPTERELLQTSEYQIKIAAGIMSGVTTADAPDNISETT